MSSGFTELARRPDGHRAPGEANLRCCCGNVDCAFLQHGNAALDALEKDVKTAAQLGQALLVRHEAYVADAEEERSRWTKSFTALEGEKKDLEAKNVQIIEENKALLEQIEGLNNALADSDAHVKSLTATLRSSQYEIQKLSVLASRTEQLDRQLSQLEEEQAQLQATLATTEEEKREAAARWQNSERVLAGLQVQMEDIENEARVERARHAEVVGRMKRRRAVETELEGAANRLKGNTPNDFNRANNVVSCFVKEILEDNANLQLNMVEMQELLANSMDDIETLRQQIPLSEGNMQGLTLSTEAPEIGKELVSDTARPINQELHVHHHYHAATSTQSAGRSRSQAFQRSRRKRPAVMSGHSTPGSSSHSPTRAPREPRISDISSVASISPRRPARWSISSIQTRSSVTSDGPASPHSPAYLPSTILEQSYDTEPTEYSRPSSPESNVWSPPLKPMYKSNVIDQTLSLTTGAEPSSPSQTNARPRPIPSLMGLQKAAPVVGTAPTEPVKELSEDASSYTLTPVIPPVDDEPFQPPSFLRRTASQDSLLSISGMDIHSSAPRLRTRQSQWSSFSKSGRQDSGPILTAATAAGLRSASDGSNREIKNARGVLRSSLGNKQDRYAPLQDTLGRRFGGWLSGRWSGGGASVSTADLAGKAGADGLKSPTDAANQDAPESETVVETPEKETRALRRKSCRMLITAELDEDALRECLEE